MKRFVSLSLAVLIVSALLCTFAFAANSYIIDNDDLLTDDEILLLEQQAQEVSDRWECSVCVLTTPDLEGKSAEAFAEDYFDQNNLGYHGTYDGILLVVSMDERDFFITSAGEAQLAVTGERLDTLADAFLPYLSDGEYYRAFSAYIRQCDYQLEHRDDPIIDPEPEPEPRVTAGGAIVSAVMGFFGSMIPTGVMKSKNNNVSKKQTATNYARPGSLQLYVQQDQFLRTETNRVRVESNSGRGGYGGGGGISHTSSSGVSHTGGGGKF